MVPTETLSGQQIADALAVATARVRTLEQRQEELQAKDVCCHCPLSVAPKRPWLSRQHTRTYTCTRQSSQRQRLADTGAELKTTKDQIKAWLAEFEAREGRAAEKADKTEIRDLYVANRTLKSRAESLTATIEADVAAAGATAEQLEQARDVVDRLSRAQSSAPPPAAAASAAAPSGGGADPVELAEAKAAAVTLQAQLTELQV